MVHNGFQKNNSWKVQLAKVNVVRTELGLTISGSKPSIEGTISWSEGREKTRESGFIEKTIPKAGKGVLLLTGKLMFGENGSCSRSLQKCT